MKVQDLRKELSNGITDFAFIKKDGSVRIAKGTTNLTFVPVEKHPKGTGKASDKVLAYFDLEKDNWRCLSVNTEFVTA
jgi:hypothetical protein